jgi:hypothetical protein
MAQAFVRSLKIKYQQYLTKQKAHAHRKDMTSEIRPGAEPGMALVWTPPGLPEGGDPKDYRALYHLSKRHRRFSEREGAAIGLHLLVGVSPSWIKAAGSLHDTENPRNKELLDAAVAWVESWAGARSVIGARLDLDEAGGGVVDVFVVPVFEQKHKSGSTKLTVSINKALTRLQATHETDYSYEALQTSWHAWAQENLDPDLQRGEPAYKTNRVHLRPAEYKRLQDHLRAEEALRAKQEELEQREAALAERERRNDETAADLEHKAATMMQVQKDVFKAAVAVLSDPKVRTIHLAVREQDQSSFDAPRAEAQRLALMKARPLWPVMRQLLEVVQDKHRAVDRFVDDLRVLRDEVDNHIRKRIEQAADEAEAFSTFDCP